MNWSGNCYLSPIFIRSQRNLAEGTNRCEREPRAAPHGCTDCKAKLAQIVIDQIEPIQEKRKYYLSHKDLVLDILRQGKEEAEKFAGKTVKEVKEALGNGIL